jgi:hypothetical protein
MELEQPQHHSTTTSFTAQHYSSATLVSLLFRFGKEIFGEPFKSVRISTF